VPEPAVEAGCLPPSDEVPAVPVPEAPRALEIGPAEVALVESEALQTALDEWSPQARERRRTLDPEALRRVLARIVEPEEVGQSEAAASRELEVLADAVTAESLGDWRRLPVSMQQCLVGLAVARARHLQDEVEPDVRKAADPGGRLDEVFRAMTRYSQAERPGFVFGLMRRHRPRTATWHAEARYWWQRLVSLLPASELPEPPNPERALARLTELLEASGDDAEISAQVLKAIEAGVPDDDPRLVRLMAASYDLLRDKARFKRLRRAIRTAEEEQRAVDERELPAAALPPTWPHAGLVRGRRALIVGGEVREEARTRIAEVFGFGELQWCPTDRLRRMDGLASSIRQGSIDLVLILQSFVTHKAAQMVVHACRDAGTTFACVERGYGVERICQAIERFCPSPETTDAGQNPRAREPA
jgi:hypothetical protein